MDSMTGMDFFLIAAGGGIAVFLFFVGLYSERIIMAITNGVVSKARDARLAEEARTERVKIEQSARQDRIELAKIELETERERSRRH